MSDTMGELFRASLLKLVNNMDGQHYSNDHNLSDDPAVEILDFREETYSDGYCETCWYEYTVVEIDYRTADGTRKTYVYGDDFADLVRDLTKL